MGSGSVLMARHKNGSEIPVAISLSPMSAPFREFQKEDLIIVCLRDMTEQVQLQKREILRVEKMAEVQRQKMLGEMSRNIVHDFNNMIWVVRACLDLIRDNIAIYRDEECENFFADIRTALDQLSDLSNQILLFADGGSPVLQEHDIGEIVTGMVPLFRAATRGLLKLNIQTWHSPQVCHVSELQIRQIMLNLVTNAVKALILSGRCEADSAINIYCGTVLSGEGHVFLECAENILPRGQYHYVRVVDKGKGMTKDELSCLFKPYASLQSERGHGLGLSVVKQILEANKGHIHVESAPSKGADFTIYFPVVYEVEDLNASLEEKMRYVASPEDWYCLQAEHYILNGPNKPGGEVSVQKNLH